MLERKGGREKGKERSKTLPHIRIHMRFKTDLDMLLVAYSDYLYISMLYVSNVGTL